MPDALSADVQRIALNASCMMISGERTEQLVIFCGVTGFESDFLSFIDVELIRFFHGALQYYCFPLETLHYADGKCVTNSSWLPSGRDSRQKYRTEVTCHFSYSGEWSPEAVRAAIQCHADSGPGRIVRHQPASRSFIYSETIDWKNAAEIRSFNCTVSAVHLPTRHFLAQSSNVCSSLSNWFLVFFTFAFAKEFNFFYRRLCFC